MSATPRPWKANHSRMGFGSRVWDAEGSLACEVSNDLREPEENTAIADLIVESVNAHDAHRELLEAAKEVRAADYGVPYGGPLKRLYDAIAKVEDSTEGGT